MKPAFHIMRSYEYVKPSFHTSSPGLGSQDTRNIFEILQCFPSWS